MPFFEYNQNNSGGGFDSDHDKGISHIVIIEAESARVANVRAEDIGLYFGGYGDCECCGDRWYAAYGDGDFVPSTFGRPIQDVDFDAPLNFKWITDGPEAYVHFTDGKVQGYGLPNKELS